MKIYLDFDFLENFFLNPDDSDTYFLLKRLLCSAQSPAELVVNFDFEEAYQNPEKKVIFRQIASKFPISNLSFTSNITTISFYETSISMLFLMNDLSDNVSEYGCVKINSNQLEKASSLLFPEKYRVDQGQTDWFFLKSCQLPCNALIVTDNYLFANDKALENTKAILLALMPKTLSIDFDLTIIGYAAKDFKTLKSQADELTTFLNSKFHYKVNLTIIREDHHARLLQTNYGRFHSEKGFGLFQNRRIKRNDETTIEFNPVTEFGQSSSVNEVRKAELLKCKKILQTDRMPDKQFGSKKNRLLG